MQCLGAQNLEEEHHREEYVVNHSSSCSYSSASASPAFHGAVSSSRFRSNEENGDVLNPNCGDSCEFVDFLNLELDKLNAFFVDKEEEYVIRLQVFLSIQNPNLSSSSSSSFFFFFFFFFQLLP